MSIVIKAENLNFSYPETESTPKVDALKNISFEIEEGTFTAILGHNGSGKSTLAKILCMILESQTGSLTIMGKDVNSENITDEEIMDIRKEVGMVFQNPDNQIVATIVEEDVAFGCENLGIPSVEIRERVDNALKEVGMYEYREHPVAKLSGGQKQRVAIAGVIAMRRKCIIFDESTAMLDPIGRKDVLNIIKKLNREHNITVILITHYMNEASMADKILVMNEGLIVASDTPEKIFGDPQKMWDIGLDVPQTTEFLYKLNHYGYSFPITVFDPEAVAEIVSKEFSSVE